MAALPSIIHPRPLLTLLLLTLLSAAPAAAVVPVGWSPKPGEYVWKPAIVPSGPLVVVVSLPLQQLHVYRNGVRIGASSISSGKPGHETPVGVFTILQKHVEHYSNLYDNAPMPFMQRLTWDGVALHAGKLPGRPASHGCIRLPQGFAKALFAATRTGDVVIVSDGPDAPGITTGGDVLRALGAPAAVPGDGDFWAPERVPDGPVSVVLSTVDRRMVVTRNGRPIGSAGVRVEEGLRLGTHAYSLLDGHEARANPLLPDRPARRWLAIDIGGAGHADTVRDAITAGRLEIPVDVARRIDDLLQPGATVVITDAPLGKGERGQKIELEAPTPAP